MKKINLNLLLFLFSGIVMISCKNENREQETETLDVEEVEKITPDEEEAAIPNDRVQFENPGLQTVFNSYIDLKNAFVTSDAGQVKDEASNFSITLSNIDAGQELKESAEVLSNSEEIEEQREAFLIVSEELEKMLEGSIISGTVYKQYCPMAFNDQGGSWLSVSQEIRNPYFGDKMLKCGSVQKTYSEDGTIEAED